MADTGNRTPWVMVDDFQRDIVSLALEVRNCGTGAGGFKGGNTCAGKGKGGGGGVASYAPATDLDAMFDPTSRYSLEDAVTVHRKDLDSFRNRLIKGNEKAKAGLAAAMEKAKEAHLASEAHFKRRSELFDEISNKRASLEKLKAEGDTLLAGMLEKRIGELELERSELVGKTKEFVGNQSRAEAEKQAAIKKVQDFTREHFAKEAKAIDKEDGIPAAERKAALAERDFRIETTAALSYADGVTPDQVAQASRVEAARFCGDIANPTIHAQALAGEIEYHTNGTRAQAKGSVTIGNDHVDSATVGKTVLDLRDSKQTYAHEFGHQLEHGNAETAKLADDFLKSRVQGESPVSLTSVLGKSMGYDDHEFGREDDFAKTFAAVNGGTKFDKENVNRAYYAGKAYAHQGKVGEYGTKLGATEVLSMGLELMATNPVAFAKADPEWFDFTAGVATGRLLRKTRATRRYRASGGARTVWRKSPDGDPPKKVGDSWVYGGETWPSVLPGGAS